MKYIAKPVEVDAFVITHVGKKDKEGYVLLKLNDMSDVLATPDMMSRMMPRIGDYWVIQSDGYEYLNPKDVFERKYAPKP